MSTKKPIAANRRHAQHSTGSPSPEGKAASRFNAFNLGINVKQPIMFSATEDEPAYLTVEYHEQYQPANPIERFRVVTIVNNQEMDPGSDVSAGTTFAGCPKSFIHVRRIINSCEFHPRRALNRAAAPPGGTAGSGRTGPPNPNNPCLLPRDWVRSVNHRNRRHPSSHHCRYRRSEPRRCEKRQNSTIETNWSV